MVFDGVRQALHKNDEQREITALFVSDHFVHVSAAYSDPRNGLKRGFLSDGMVTEVWENGCG